jgi:prepilin-type N-terminal cleavage/methylation domain-containing protein
MHFQLPTAPVGPVSLRRLPATATRRGVTLVEMMVVVAIIAALMALVSTAVGAARESARRNSCSNNLRQVVMGLHRHVASNSAFPAGNTYSGITPSSLNNTWCNSNGTVLMPWTVAVLPYIEQENLFDRFNPNLTFMTNSFDPPPNVNGSSQVQVPLPVLQCPSSSLWENPMRNNYFGVQGSAPVGCTEGPSPNGTRSFYLNGMMFVNSRVGFGHVRDGLSHVFVLGETNMSMLCLNTASGRREFFRWTLGGKPGSVGSPLPMPMQLAGMDLPLNSWRFSPLASIMLQQGTRGFGSDHPGGVYFALADGSVQFISEYADFNVLKLLSGRRDGGLLQDAVQ